MNRSCLLPLLVALAGCAVSVRNELPPARADLALTHVEVVDVESGQLLRDQTLLIDGDRITQMGASPDIRVPTSARTIDGRGKYLIPGLWDMYSEAADSHAAGEPVWSLYLAHGILGVRDVKTSVSLDELAKLRSDLASGALPGPQLVYAGRMLESGERRSTPGDIMVVRNAEEIQSAVDTLAASGVDYIKTGPYLLPELFPLVVAAARKHRMPVTGWVITSWADASNAGLTGIDHFADLTRNSSLRRAEYYRMYLGNGPFHPSLVPREEADPFFDALENSRDGVFFQETLATMARNRTWIATNHGTWDSLAHDGDDPTRHRFRTAAQVAAFNKKVHYRHRPKRDGILADFGALRAAGVPMLAGSGFSGLDGATPGLTLHDALYWLTRGGYTPLEVLRMATINPAQFLGISDSTGTVTAGKRADLVLLDANPLQDIRHSTSIVAVISKGQYLDRDALDQLLLNAEANAEAGARADPSY